VRSDNYTAENLITFQAYLYKLVSKG
jgi:hypothetical protein